MVHLWLAALLAGAVPEGVVTVKVGDMQAALDSASAYDVSGMTVGGQQVLINTGGRGAALTLGGQWYGAGMRDGSEVVTALKLVADGQDVALTPAGAGMSTQTVTGNRVVVTKDSTLGPVKHQAETTFEPDLMVQRHSFEATEDAAVGSFYAFIYSVWVEAKQWLAKPLHGPIRRGEFNADKSNKPQAACRWLAQYDATTQRGMIAYFIEPYTGPDAFHAFWDRDGDHKLLAQPLKGTLVKGTKLQYTMVLRFFTAAPAQWESRAQEVAKTLATRFPPQEPTGADAAYGDGVPEDGVMTLQTGRTTVPMSAKQAWTIQKIDYDGNTVAHERGFYGTVMIPEGSNFWGTGHTEGGREIVHALKLTVDGTDQPVEVDKTVSGKKITLVKDSTIWKLKCHAEVEITDDHIFERTQLEALEDCDLHLLYYFMHCFVGTTPTWAGELPDGAFVSGELKSDNDFEINKDTRWVAQYEPNWHYGLLCYTPKVIAGPGSASKIWDLDVTRYHKYYLQQNAGQKLKRGEKLDFSVVVKIVPNETGDWSATKAAVAALKRLYPPQ